MDYDGAMTQAAAPSDPIRGRARRVRKNLRQGLALAWAASPDALVRYSVLGMISAAMPPITVYLGAVLVDRIAEARQHALSWNDVLPIIIGMWVATGAQRAIGSSTPPATGTVQQRGAPLGAAVARPDANTIDLPSGSQPCTLSAPGCHVSRFGSPPSAETR